MYSNECKFVTKETLSGLVFEVCEARCPRNVQHDTV